MVKRFYLDTSIWMDIYEDRIGYKKEHLGDFALKLFSFIKAENHRIFISDLLIKELEMNYSIEEINGMINPYKENIQRIISKKEERKEAEIIAKKRKIPKGDVLHAILARNNNLILITRDKHFKNLNDICQHHKPEDIV
ncbi:PIN domain-containing protein [Candidatus Woesearchaeota archaeon]|nr:PIN domain-containing protein [Candidatus Woesearchaeota archaeon]